MPLASASIMSRREQFDYILDVTSFKSKALWAEDTFKDVPTKVKSAFTR